MTERNFTSVIPGFYRMRDGGIAEVVEMAHVRLRASHPARGMTDVSPEELSWTLKGALTYFENKQRQDLITFLGTERPREKKMVTKTLTGLANVYANGGMAIYTTKELADDCDHDRIACVEMTGEYEVEEEV